MVVEDNVWLRDIVARSSFIAERLSGAFEAQPSPNALIEARLEAWCQAAAGGDWQRFARRLAYEGWDLETVRPFLGHVALCEDQPLPEWAVTLQEVVNLAESGDLPGLHCLDEHEPLPFEDVLWPCVYVARQRMLHEAGATYAQLPVTCQGALERGLLRTLVYSAERTLLSRFSVFRVLQERRESPSLDNAPPGEGPYRAFVATMLGEGLRPLFHSYPVLARLLATQIDAWVEATSEFLQRLQADADLLNDASRLTSRPPFSLSALKSLQPGLSDPHANGRAVIAVEFESGLSVIYKPRSVGAEQGYQKITRWLNEHGLTPPLRTLNVIDRGTHGWVETVTPQPCADRDALQRFYRRAGMLLGLFYALQSTDYHYENLVAERDQPVPVDHEMLLSPYLRQDFEHIQAPGEGDSLYLYAQQQLGQSVLGTGLLPVWETGQDGQSYDISGLGGGGYIDEARQVRHLAWQHINTDRMTRVWETSEPEAWPDAHLPMLKGVAGSIHAAQAELIAGFEDTYRLLLKYREGFLASDGPLAALEAQDMRFTFRRTHLYGAVLDACLAPKYLRDGSVYSFQLDVLARALIAQDERPALWSIVAAEQAALARMDIPRFTVPADSRDLVWDGATLVEDCFIASPYDMACQHIAAMSEQDLGQQVALIQAALAKQTSAEQMDGVGGSAVASAVSSDSIVKDDGEVVHHKAAFYEAALHEVALHEVARIAETLQRHALHLEHGVTWIQREYDERLGHIQLQPLGYDLYSGVGGIALFFAALSMCDEADSRWADLVLAALQPLRHSLHHAPAMLDPRDLSIGGASGLGSLVYALVRVGEFLGETALFDEALCVADRITPESIARDVAFDVISGAAGAILGLLALHDTVPEARPVLDKAVLCGQHLLDSRVASGAGIRAWPTLGDRMLTGFSHGAAGIAYALLRLYAVTARPAFRDVAEEAIAYEHSVFNQDVGNWPDFRDAGSDTESFMVSWCHGAPGIGLARRGGLSMLDTPQVRADIDVAVKTTRAFGARGVDHLCCGTLGRAEFLLEASERLARPELQETAFGWVAEMLTRADSTGGYTLSLSAAVPQWLAPGFFQGLAGLGYTLLRLTCEQALPLVLLWA